MKPVRTDPNGEAGDKYTGRDRFGQVVDRRRTTSRETAKDRPGLGLPGPPAPDAPAYPGELADLAG